MELNFKILNVESAEINFIGKEPATVAQEVSEGALFIKIPKSDLHGRKNEIKLAAYHDGKEIATFSTNFLGPTK
jgi:hypothetical protein